MRQKFVPEDFAQDIFLKMQNLKQESMSIDEYIAEFEKLSMLCDLEEKVEHKIARFLTGLNEQVAEKVELQPYWSFEELCRVAARVEKQNKAKKSKTYVKTYDRSRFEKEKVGSSATPTSRFERFNQTPDKYTKPLEPEEKRMCFKCKGYGHIQSNCPSRRIMTLQDIQEIKDSYNQEGKRGLEDRFDETVDHGRKTILEDGYVSEIEAETKGQALVLRRALHSAPTPPEVSQREKIFLTRCKVEDRLCEMIIDTGSCTNVVSTTLVDKLKWPTTEHPQPYKLHWLNNSSDVKVNQQALISFSIGNFHDKVLCDVCPMDACHILLGRPWQYDRFVKFDGRTNVYIVKRGKGRNK